MCDRHRQSRVALQRGFVDAVAAPLFRAAARLLPGLAPAVRQIEENRRAMEGLDDAALLAQVCTPPRPCALPAAQPQKHDFPAPPHPVSAALRHQEGCFSQCDAVPSTISRRPDPALQGFGQSCSRALPGGPRALLRWAKQPHCARRRH
jgi:hypothetical protein